MASTSTSLLLTPARAPNKSALSTPMQTAPSTPSTQPVVARPSPGTFKHPRLAEIVRRQNKTLLTPSNVRSAAINAVALVLSFAFRKILSTIIITLVSLLPLSKTTASSSTSTILLATRALFLLNIIISLRQKLPYISTTDNIDDIPLTPSQRSLLGLPASLNSTPIQGGSPFAPSTSYVTPPRYHRRLSSNSNSNSTSFSASPPEAARSTDRRSISANYSASPLSTSRYTLGFSPNPTASQTQPFNRTATASSTTPFSPSGSPLFHKAIERQQRRQSQSDFRDSEFGRSSFGAGGAAGLSRSHSVRDDGSGRGGVPGNPSGGRAGIAAGGGGGARKGVNFKWLYDKEYSLAGSGHGGGDDTARTLASSQSMNF